MAANIAEVANFFHTIRRPWRPGPLTPDLAALNRLAG
jgi:hypothetical protein